jgi:hypothetical protein
VLAQKGDRIINLGDFHMPPYISSHIEQYDGELYFGMQDVSRGQFVRDYLRRRCDGSA